MSLNLSVFGGSIWYGVVVGERLDTKGPGSGVPERFGFEFGSSSRFYTRLLQTDRTSEDRLRDKHLSSHATN